MTQGTYKAILFDFDGVLAKSMEDNFAAWKNAMNSVGVVLEPSDYFPIEGMSVRDVAKHFLKKEGLNEDRAEEIIKKKEAYYLANHNFMLYPGVEAYTNALKTKGIPMGVVTAARYERIVKSVPEDFLSKFKVIITSDKTKRGKPFPDPYLEGARELGVDIRNCIVVENAPMGIQSAKSAGAYCTAICSTLPKEQLTEADEVVETFSDLKNSPVMREFLK